MTASNHGSSSSVFRCRRFYLGIYKRSSLVSKADDPQWVSVSRHTCQLIHDVCARVLLQQNSSSWPIILHSFACVLEFLLRQPMHSPYSSAYSSRIQPIIQCFETLRCLLP